MALSGLVGSTYVHSNIYNLHNSIDGSILDARTNSDPGLTQIIDELKNIRNNLEDIAKSFLGNESPEQFSNRFFNSSDTYSSVATEILTRPHMKNLLLQKVSYNKKDLESFFGRSAIPKKLKNMFNDKDSATLLEEEVVKMITDTLEGQEFFTSDRGTQRKNLSKILGNKSRVDEALTKVLKSKEGKIKNIIRSELRERFNSQSKPTFPQEAFDYFKQEFLRKIQELGICYDKEKDTPEMFIERVRQELEKINIQTQKTGSGASGSLNEDFNAAVLISDSRAQVSIQVVGKKTEEQLSKTISMLKTHHAQNKQSQSDWLITNARTGVQVRVQNKNGIEVLQKILKTNQNIPQINKIQDTTKYLSLIQQLSDSGVSHLQAQDIANLSYLLANSIWFNIKGTYNSNDGEKRKKWTDTGGLKYVNETIEQFFAREITNFIGISFRQNFHILQGAPAANAFFLFSNKAFVPTYMIIDDIIKQMQREEAKLFNLKVTLKTSGISYAYSSVKSFYEAKQQAVGKLDPSQGYTDQRLLAVGGEQGKQIIESLNIERIKLNVNLNTLLKTSWT